MRRTDPPRPTLVPYEANRPRDERLEQRQTPQERPRTPRPGIAPEVASLDDHARMLAAHGRDQDRQRILTLHRLIELERGVGRGIDL